MQQQNGSNSAVIIGGDVGLVLIITEKDHKVQGICVWGRRGGGCTAQRARSRPGTYNDTELAVAGVIERPARSAADPPRFDVKRVVVLAFSKFYELFKVNGTSPSPSRKRPADARALSSSAKRPVVPSEAGSDEDDVMFWRRPASRTPQTSSRATLR